MENNSGFDPLKDTMNVLSQLEMVYFIPVLLMLAFMLVTGITKRRFPTRYKWKKGKGFERIDVQAKFDNLNNEQQNIIKKHMDEF